MQIKQESVKLARLYINKVLFEVDHVEENAHKEPMQEFILLQGVRFAFRVHQVNHSFSCEILESFWLQIEIHKTCNQKAQQNHQKILEFFSHSLVHI